MCFRSLSGPHRRNILAPDSNRCLRPKSKPPIHLTEGATSKPRIASTTLRAGQDQP